MEHDDGWEWSIASRQVKVTHQFEFTRPEAELL
jgi:hypothetical protein